MKGLSSQFNRNEIQEFLEFIGGLDVVDMFSIVSIFIWFNRERSSMSCLDMFFLYEGLIELWNIEGKFVVERDVSDHSPIWIKANNTNLDIEIFNIFNCCLSIEVLSHLRKIF